MTAIQQSKAAAAYKTQWDPVAKDIRDATGLGDNSQLCISYLFGNTVFRGIPEFVSYFRENDSLEVPAGQELAIWDVSVLNHDSEAPVSWMQTNGKRHLSILDNMLATLGKVCKFVFANPQANVKLSFTTDKGLELTLSERYKLVAEHGDLDIRLSDLFRCMVHCKTPRMALVAGQTVRVWGISPEEEARWNQAKNIASLKDFIITKAPGGCNVGIAWKKAIFSIANYQGTDCRGVNIFCKEGECVFSIKDLLVYPSARGFVERLSLGEIEVPPGGTLKIQDGAISLIAKEHEKVEKAGFRLMDFLLNQVLAPHGHTASIEPLQSAEGYSIDLDVDGDLATFSSKTGFVLKKAKAALLVDLYQLGQRMISERCSSLVFAPNQRLHIYGLREEEFSSLKNVDLLEAINKILCERNPLGFSWNLSLQGGYQIRESRIAANGNKELLHVLALSSSDMELRLGRPNGATFIKNIVTHSHPALLEGLKERDTKAMTFLLFRAFFYYLCGNFRTFRSDELPDFFRPEELRALVPNSQGRMQTEGANAIIVMNERNEVCQLIDESTAHKIQTKIKDPVLTEAIKKINQSEECTNKIDEILSMTPEAFDTLVLDTLPAPIQTVMKEIRALANQELRKSPFIMKWLPAYLDTLPPADGSSSSDKSTDKKEE